MFFTVNSIFSYELLELYKSTWKRKVNLKEEDALDRTKWRKGLQLNKEIERGESGRLRQRGQHRLKTWR